MPPVQAEPVAELLCNGFPVVQGAACTMAPVCQLLNEWHGCAVHDACHSDSLPGCYKLTVRMERYMRICCFGCPRPRAVHRRLPVCRVVLWGDTSAQPHLRAGRRHHTWIAELPRFIDKSHSMKKAGTVQLVTFKDHTAKDLINENQ